MRDISGGWNALKPTYLQYFRMLYSETHSFEIEELFLSDIQRFYEVPRAFQEGLRVTDF